VVPAAHSTPAYRLLLGLQLLAGDRFAVRGQSAGVRRNEVDADRAREGVGTWCSRGPGAVRAAQGDDEIDPEFKQADITLVVGANDVVNPAAETTPGAPIYGMPILHANQARQVVFMKRSMRPGFAGIENELLYEPITTLLFGDAMDTLSKLLAELKAHTV
jgi:hypothetical protein